MWLLKTEPGTYSFADLEREGRTAWDGVSNPVAIRNLRAMKEGDRLVVYHTGEERAAVGTGRVARAAYSPGSGKGGVVVDVEAGARLTRPVRLDEMRALDVFRGSPLLVQPRLSVVPLTEEQWRALVPEPSASRAAGGPAGAGGGPAADPLIVLSTVGRPEDAERIARELVERGLAACVNVVPAVVSFYRWKGQLERDEERLLVVKTTAARFEALREALVALHPYDLPEVIALPVAAGHAPYLEWVEASVAVTSSP